MTLANSGVTAGTYRSVTVDAKGRVTAGTNPTTLSGYGITDAYTKAQVDTSINTKVSKSGDTMSGSLTNTGAATVPALYKTSTSGNAMMRVGVASYDKGLGLSLSGDLIFGNWSTVSNLSTSWDKI